MAAGRLSVVAFRWQGRFGCFLRAEAAKAGYGYPVPPRTAALGLVAAILGLEKDVLATELNGAQIALSGSVPGIHRHTGNYRKDPPAPMPWKVSAKSGGSSKDELNTQLTMDWMVRPSFLVRVAAPGRWHNELAGRIRDGRHHYTPVLGLAGFLAQVEHVADEELVQDNSPGSVLSVVRSDEVDLDVQGILDGQLQVMSLAMPRSVDGERRFSHARYHVERGGRPIPVRRVASAWRTPGGERVSFL